MAEMDTSGGGGHKKGPGVKKAKKLSTRIDLTPMVDLGFLLITFFIYTTTMAKPRTMEIRMPDTRPTDEPTAFSAESTITVIPVKDHRVIYYCGQLTKPEQLLKSDCAKIRGILLSKK